MKCSIRVTDRSACTVELVGIKRSIDFLSAIGPPFDKIQIAKNPHPFPIHY
jgi:hypothetical protein